MVPTQEQLRAIRDRAVRMIWLDVIGQQPETRKIVTTVPISADIPEDGEAGYLQSIAIHLAVQANQEIERMRSEGKGPAGIADCRVHYTDGRYRLTLEVV